MLYEKNRSEQLDQELFQNPTCEYRGTPFWAWNCKLTKEMLEKQIEYLKLMGFGGFHMHSRTGMDIPYLTEEFMDLVEACVNKAEKEEMLAWLYDEDRWPSGAAGGLITKDPKYRQRHLLLTTRAKADAVEFREAYETGKPCLLACFDIQLHSDGTLSSYERIDEGQEAKGVKWYAYVCAAETSPWFNNQTYIDTMNPEAMQKFIDITYKGYQKRIGDRFDKNIPAIFTDEPQTSQKETLKFPEDKTDVHMPWTPDLVDTYRQQYGRDLTPHLPELIWDLPEGKISVDRYSYHDHIAERFTSTFADMCGGWCEKNGFRLTGHVMAEPTLHSQTLALGEAMRSYRSFQIPGIDMLCDKVELTTAKQAQSAVRQYGREGMMSELYGVTNWDFDFRGHKFQGDWQAALGVTVRVPHLSWVSMGGEAKRDYPASINYQSPWYKEYPYIENHFARLNTVLTRGKALVNVGVIHPVESYWLHWGPSFSTAAVRRQMEDHFQDLTRWLCAGGVDFDFISESLLPDLCPNASAPLKVGEMSYDAIIVPACETLRETTWERLNAFRHQGGRLIFLGEAPKYIDAKPDARGQELCRIAQQIPFDENSVLNALDDLRYIELRSDDGSRTNNLVYQLRQDNDCRWLFIARAVKEEKKDLSYPRQVRITVRGVWRPECYDTVNGQISSMPCRVENGNTVMDCTLYASDSLLLRLEEGEPSVTAQAYEQKRGKMIFESDLRCKVTYRRLEPNALLLDMAAYALDDEPLQREEEILRLDTICREKLGWPIAAVAQPWTLDPEVITHKLKLRFHILCEVKLSNLSLAVEGAEEAEISLNGQAVSNKITGWYVDESIKTVALPPLKAGDNILEIVIPFGKRTSTEWCYILGDFNVKVEGVIKTLLPATKEIGFSSITNQGMPFYGGNLVYETQIDIPAGDLEVQVRRYRGAMVRVWVDGEDKGIIAYDPYCLRIPNMAAGTHKVELKLFGNRYNTFGALHDTEDASWAGPNLWRTEKDHWCYEYRLRETGILSSPIFRVLQP